MPLLLLSQEQFKQILALLSSQCHQSSASTQLDTENHIANLVANYSANQCLQNLFGKILSLVSVQGSSNLDLKHFIFSFNLVKSFCLFSQHLGELLTYSPLHFMFHKLCSRSKSFVQFSNGESIVIAYVGIVQLTTALTLHNFLYKPSFSFNLIFVSQLTNSLKFSLIFMSILCLICFHWRDAIAAKIMGLEDNHCRTLTSLSSSKHPIGCK